MKFYLSLILFLFLNYIAHSQNLTGRWVGTFTEQRGPSYIYEMNLEQTGNDIKGTSKYSFYKRFGIIELEGSIKNNLFENGKRVIDWQKNDDIKGKITIEIDDLLFDLKSKYDIDFRFDQMDMLIADSIKVAESKYKD